MFKGFSNKFSFWSYVGEGAPCCFFSSLGGVFFVMCLERYGLVCCVCSLVVTVLTDLSSVWGL